MDPHTSVETAKDDRRESVLKNLSRKSMVDIDEDGNLQKIFNKAKRSLNPNPFSNFILAIYAKRVMVMVFMIHFVYTFVIWGHFGLIKHGQQKLVVPAGAPNFYWKRIAPPLEFGSMHAILFQMSLIPLTMSRFTIAALSKSSINKYFPMNKMLAMHIHLGYTMITIVFFATVFFFIFFGKLCADGEQAFCTNLRTEIMSTGYAILATLLVIGGTSYFRYKMPYELFYVIHHLVFAMYLLAILHTFDRVTRTGERNRSQTVKWFAATLLYYVADRAAMHMMHKYNSKLEDWSLITNSSGIRTMTLKMKRPELLFFKPGQYVFLRVKGIDLFWHPFSIASSPTSPFLEFYIEVFDKDSWTDKLWDGLSEKGINEFEVMGPYGTALVTPSDFTHGIAIGAGTGIVPIFSLYRQHVTTLLRLSPEALMKNIEANEDKIASVIKEQMALKGTVLEKFIGLFKTKPEPTHGKLERTKSEVYRKSIKEVLDDIGDEDGYISWERLKNNENLLNKQTKKATRIIYGKVFEAFLALLQFTLFGLTISWNLLPDTMNFKFKDNPIDIEYEGMYVFLEYFTAINHAIFFILAFTVWDLKNLIVFVDVAVAVVAPFADWFFLTRYEANGTLSPPQIIAFGILTAYMAMRLWSNSIRPLSTSIRSVGKDDELSYLQFLEMVWVTRSAHLVTDIGPQIENLWSALVEQWGREDASIVGCIKIYVTDTDRQACEELREQLKDTDLLKSGAITFGRPDFGKMIEDFSIGLANTHKLSFSFLAFCGSPKLSNILSNLKINNDMMKILMGYRRHSMEFHSESYGGVKAAPREEAGNVQRIQNNKSIISNEQSTESKIIEGSL